MTSIAERAAPKDHPTAPVSARERLRQGPKLEYKDVFLPEPIGRLRISQLSQLDLEAMVRPLTEETKPEGNGAKGPSHGWKLQTIPWGLINDDGSRVYENIEEGIREIGRLPRAAVDELFAAFDELNLATAEAREKLGKDSAKATS